MLVSFSSLLYYFLVVFLSFSFDGNSVFSIQSPRKGSTYLIKYYSLSLIFICFSVNLFRWGLEKKKPLPTKSVGKEKKKEEESSDADEETFALTCYYQKKKEIHKIPSTRLRESEDGVYLAVGGADGTVAVVTSEDFREVHRVSCHDLPVTGLGFAPYDITKEKGWLFFLSLNC
jgi:WD40 repeat protein